jgi:hypothetical protein
MFTVTSVFGLTGDATKNLNQLTTTQVSGSSDLATLSTTNYLVAGDETPNPVNQEVFMNQPLSWWLTSLNSGKVKYTPVSNYVNWAYVDANKNVYHISITISNLLIPNKTSGVTRNAGSMNSTVTFEPKFGLSRVDTHSM